MLLTNIQNMEVINLFVVQLLSYSKINCIPEGRKILPFISIICIKIGSALQFQSFIFEYEFLKPKGNIINLALLSKLNIHHETLINEHKILRH